MPLPFILAGAAVIAGGFGVKKGFDAKSDFDEAQSINARAQRIFDEAKSDLEKTRQRAQSAMEHLGETKFRIYENSIIPFSETFDKIKNINFQDSNLANAGNLPAVSREEMNTMHEQSLELKDAFSGGVTALGSGGLAGLAAYGGVMTLGTASTGTAIGALSGVAATNATLAWLGGGSLAAGGLGMAGGMAVLGGIVAGPVLAVGGMFLASKAEAAKEDAYANHSKAELAAEEMKTAGVATEGIQRRFEEIDVVLTKLESIFNPLLQSLTELVESCQDYSQYSQDNKKGIFITASLAKTIKNILEAPILSKDGTVTRESREAIEEGTNALTAQ